MKALKDQTVTKIKGLSVTLVLVIILFILSVTVFYLISDEVVLENETWIDEFVFRKLSGITSPAVTRVMIAITFFGSSYFLLPAYSILTAYYLFFKKNIRLSINVSAIGLTSIGVLFGIKDIFQRHRPLNPLIKNVAGFSFPSGHSFSAFTFFGLIAYIIWKAELDRSTKFFTSAIMIVFACAVAFSRVYLHVHFATDAIAGFCLSIIWLTISLWLLNKIPLRKFK